MYTKNEEELQALGERLGYLLEKNDVLILAGDKKMALCQL